MSLPLPFTPGAVIFDLDGTLVDNMALHAEAFAAFAARHGLPPLTLADRARLDGRRNSEIFPVLFGREMPRDEWLAYETEKESLYRELSRGRLAPLAGTTALLDRLESARIPIAVATSAPEPNVNHTLHEIGLAGRFPVIVRGDQVGRGKPAPDVFLAAAETLGREASACLVFEDAPMGITAARAAGMPVVAVTTSFEAGHLLGLADPPDLAVPDFLAVMRHLEFAIS
ncbi:MAG: HAD family hydrolase [Vicinamibacterales bacterium]